MKPLLEMAEFVRRWRWQMKFGELSRAPLRLLGLQWEDDVARCDWMARPADVWDQDLPSAIRERDEAMQALRDVVEVRALLFQVFSQLRSAEIRVYRQPAREPPELIITGTVTREDEAAPRVSSLAMRAMLYGFRFCLEDGVLKPLCAHKRSLEFAT